MAVCIDLRHKAGSPYSLPEEPRTARAQDQANARNWYQISWCICNLERERFAPQHSLHLQASR